MARSGDDTPVLEKEKLDTGISSPDNGESPPSYTAEEDRKLVRKLDLSLLPPLTLLYLLSFLDRSNIANARIEGLATDLNITGDQYLTGLTLYFIGYVLFEIPCNIVLKRTSPKKWLPTLTLVWGVIATLMGLIQNMAGLYAVRFFLGVAESGLFPGIVFYLSMWYKRNEQHYRVALFFSAASLAGAFGGILAYGIAYMKGVGGLDGWRWIFIIEGILTVLVSLSAYIFIQNYPLTATFLSPKERSHLLHRLSTNQDATVQETFTWAGVRAALTDPKCWLYGLAFHTLSLPLYTLSLFLPTIITELGFSAAQAQLLTIPPYALAFLLTILGAVLSERLVLRAPFIIGPSCLAIVGYIILLSVPSSVSPGAAYVGTILAAAGIYPATAIALSWPANNVSGQTKRAAACAMQISIGNCGAVIGTQLYRTEWAPRFFVGHGVACGYLVGNVVVVSALWALLARINRARDREVVERGLDGDGPRVGGEKGGAEHGKPTGERKIEDVEAWRGDESLRWRFQT